MAEGNFPLGFYQRGLRLVFKIVGLGGDAWIWQMETWGAVGFKPYEPIFPTLRGGAGGVKPLRRSSKG